MEIKLDNLTNLLKVLTWGKIIQATVFLLIVGISYGLWDNRTVVYNSLKVGARVESSGPVVIDLGQSTQEYIDATTKKASSFIAGIEILSVDFKKNTRSTAYFSIVSDDLKKMYAEYAQYRVAPVPLFTSNELRNQKVIDLINGDFSCSTVDGTSITILSNVEKVVKNVCSISIPPYYGRFSGYMNVYLLRIPTEEDISVIRQMSRDISLRIYEIDINKSSPRSN
jgi:hypothetical protein